MARVGAASSARGDVKAAAHRLSPPPPREVIAARNAVAVSFVLNGFCFATWVSRIPQVRSDLQFNNAQLGLLLLCIAIGSLIALPTTGASIQRWGTVLVVRLAGAITAIGLITAAIGVAAVSSVPITAAGLFGYGLGVGVWDVAMNVEGADVERLIGRTILPRFHAGFSIGTVAGAGLGALAVATGVGLLVHLPLVAVFSLSVMASSAKAFLPLLPSEKTPRSAWGAWLEPRTLIIGAMVFALALTEGTANDWLALAMVDGYDVEAWVGVASLGVFVSAMTIGRLVGPTLLDQFGKIAVLSATVMSAILGVLLVVFGGNPVLAACGIALWGLGASLGFPVGMSLAAEDSAYAAARVSVVSTIGYGAFLAGPPLLGFVGDQVGTLRALLVIAALLVPTLFLIPLAARR